MAKWGGRWLLPAGLAAVVTVLNAAKPAVVDDTAYLLTSRHISARPADPYGFDLFWYDKPEPAWRVLLPPVVPYWLALGFRLFGNHLFLVKLWLFPFALLFALALASLLRRFARGYDRPMLVTTVLGPAVLPLFSVMLDVPAAALGLSAVALFARACDRRSFVLAAQAGLLVGLAMQTKYTMLTLPAVLALFGLTRGRRGCGLAAVAVVVAVALFAGWEGLIARRYGESHFLFHVRDQGQVAKSVADAGARAKLAKLAQMKWDLFQPMLGHLGWLGLGAGLAATAGVGAPRWWLAGVAAVSTVGLAAVCLVPARYAGIVPGKLDLPILVCVGLGSCAGVAVLAAAGSLLFRWSLSRFVRRRRDAWFLAAWLGLELAGYFALTPFAATRRVLMLSVVGGLVAARLLSRAKRLGPRRRPPGWLPAFGAAVGVALFGVDFWDALPEKVLAERAAAVCGSGSHAVWFSGHWGFQYYCDRAGMRLVMPLRPGRADDPPASELRPGDFLVLPVLPDEDGFYRPYHGQADFALDPDALELAEEFVWDDALPARTIPDLYGGKVPVTERGHPRLRVAVYRVMRAWVPVHRENEP